MPQRLLRSIPALAAAILLAPDARGGAVKFDGTLGPGSALAGPNFLILASDGKQVGGNLFHSFSNFDLSAGESATFTGPVDVANIVARISGGSRSSIDGTVRSAISGANLFLMNPAGFLFGPHAALDLSGAFAVTTADYLDLADGERFTALPSPADDSLTRAPVSAFGFLTAAPSLVRFDGSRLATLPRQDFAVVAGKITLDAATLAAPSGHLHLISTAAPGIVPIEPGRLPDARGAITLKNHSVAKIDGTTGGSIVIRGGKLHVTGGSALTSTNNGTIHGGNIHVRLASKLTLDDGGQISSIMNRSGAGGNIRVNADDVAISGGSIFARTFYIGFDVEGTTPGRGDGGNIVLESNRLAISGGSSVATTTFGFRNGGSVRIAAARLSIDGSSNGDFTGISAGGDSTQVGNSGDIFIQSRDLSVSGGGMISTTTSGDGTGNGGDMHIDTTNLALSSGGEIAANSFGIGDGGNISLSASRLLIDGTDAKDFTGISAGVGSRGVGRGGNILVMAPRLRIDGGNSIAFTGISAGVAYLARGDGGDIVVQSEKLDLFHGATIDATTSGIGDGGNITVSASRFHIDGADRIPASGFTGISGIAAATFGLGNGGDIRVTADRFIIDGKNGAGFIGISANVFAGGVGRGGDISIESRRLAILGGSEISVGTAGTGDAGSVRIAAQRLRLDGQGSRGFTGISAQVSSTARGNGGAVLIESDDLSIAGDAMISASTFGRGDGGNIRVSAAQLHIDGALGTGFTGISAQVRPGAIGSGGDIFLNSGEVILAAGGFVSATSSGRGDGGSIHVDADRVSIDARDSADFTGISARLGAKGMGRGGDIFVQADDVELSMGGQISASSFGLGDGGGIRLLARRLNLSADLSAGRGTGIFATLESGGVGVGGNILVRGEEVAISGADATISAATFGSGDGGAIIVDAPNFSITGMDSSHPSGVLASSRSPSGNGGSIRIRSDDLTLLGPGAIVQAGAFDLGKSGSAQIESGSVLLNAGASVSVLSVRSAAGSIDIAARERIELHGGSSITASAASDGGSIFLSARDLFYLDHSAVVATAGSVLSLAGAGSGGNITVDPTFVILDHGLISANAAIGRGGNILLIADNFFSNTSRLTATGTTAGTVEIASPELDISAALTTLTTGLVDASNRLQERCVMRLGIDASSLLVIGRGGVSLMPDDPAAALSR